MKKSNDSIKFRNFLEYYQQTVYKVLILIVEIVQQYRYENPTIDCYIYTLKVFDLRTNIYDVGLDRFIATK